MICFIDGFGLQADVPDISRDNILNDRILNKRISNNYQFVHVTEPASMACIVNYLFSYHLSTKDIAL